MKEVRLLARISRGKVSHLADFLFVDLPFVFMIILFSPGCRSHVINTAFPIVFLVVRVMGWPFFDC